VEEKRDIGLLVGKKLSKHARNEEEMVVVDPDL
jgi:hypothetical protein